MSKAQLGYCVALVLTLGMASSAQAALYWTPYVSEEGGSPATYCSSWGEAASGFSCTGKYCDNLRVLCQTLPYGATLNEPDDYWSGWFSEESDGIETIVHHGGWYSRYDENYHVCHGFHSEPGFVSGVKCQGSYCDKVSIECTKAVKWNGSQNVPIGATNCTWSAPLSEENTGNSGAQDFGYNRFITGVSCSGSYCDNMRFFVCSMTDPGF